MTPSSLSSHSLFLSVLCVIVLSLSFVSAAPLVIGHRGSPLVAPENTMPSFYLALMAGADGIETDLQFTKDGVLVVLHDLTLNRTTNCTGYLSDYTWEDLQNCDASNNMPEFVGTKIPKFSDVLEFARNHSLFVVMDYKSPIMFGSAVAEIVANMTFGNEQAKSDLVSTLIGSCWTPPQLEDIATNLPGAPLQFLTSGLPWAGEGFWNMVMTNTNKPRGFSIKYTNITQEFVKQAHKHLMSVTVWTPVAQADLQTVISYDVDAIITDDPAGLVGLLKASTPSNEKSPSKGDTVAVWVVGVVAASVFVVTAIVVGIVVNIQTKTSFYSKLHK